MSLDLYADGKLVGSIHEGTAGSISHEPHDGPREVFMFGWIAGVGPAVWRSIAGIDIEQGDLRLIDTLAIEMLHDLTESGWEMVQHRGTDRHLRLTYSPFPTRPA